VTRRSASAHAFCFCLLSVSKPVPETTPAAIWTVLALRLLGHGVPSDAALGRAILHSVVDGSSQVSCARAAVVGAAASLALTSRLRLCVSACARTPAARCRDAGVAAGARASLSARQVQRDQGARLSVLSCRVAGRRHVDAAPLPSPCGVSAPVVCAASGGSDHHPWFPRHPEPLAAEAVARGRPLAGAVVFAVSVPTLYLLRAALV
jgi:hypothetical protein